MGEWCAKWGTNMCEGPGVRESKKCSRDQEKEKVLVGVVLLLHEAGCALDVIPKQGRDRARHSCSLVHSVCLEPVARPTALAAVISVGAVRPRVAG